MRSCALTVILAFFFALLRVHAYEFEPGILKSLDKVRVGVHLEFQGLHLEARN